MKFCPASLLARWFGLAALVMAAGPATAQQPIQFTKPADQDLSAKARPATPPTARRNSADAFNAPSPLFGSKTPTVNFDILPGSPNQNQFSAANAAKWKKILEDKKNWALMTPEQNLGIRRRSKFWAITDPKEDSKLSAEERFLRQDRLAAVGATNGFSHADAAYWRDDSAMDLFHRSEASSQFAKSLGGSIPGTAKNPNPMFNPNPDAGLDVNNNADADPANPFGMQQPLVRQTPEQLEDIKSFRALLESSAPEKPPEPARFTYQPAAAPNQNLQTAPAFNPSGRSFTALESGIGKPVGIAPLPGITGSRLAPAKKTTSLVQLPPWLSDTPQTITPPQRQF